MMRGVSGLLLDLTPLRESAPYRRMWFGSTLSGLGATLTAIVVGLQVYDLTGSTWSVGLVGLFALVPLVVFGLYGGAIADAHDRRGVILAMSAGVALTAAGFAVQAWLDLRSVGLLYALVAAQSAFAAVNSAARSAVVPRLVGLSLLPAANALSSLSFGVALSVGPLVGGLLVGAVGYGSTYAIEVVLAVLAITSLAGLPALPPEGEVRRAGLGSVVEGIRFLATRPNIRSTFLIDLTAMVLAMPRVLFPAVAALYLGGGATTVGVLTAAIAVGSVLGGLFSGPVGRVNRQGMAVVVAVAGWGLSIAGLGVLLAVVEPAAPPGGVRVGPLAAAALLLVLAGLADTVSAIFRSTILQAATPDALRGRLQGIFIVVVAGGPRLGDVLLGGIGERTTEATAALVGGLACVVGVVLFAWRHPGFRAYDARDPQP